MTTTTARFDEREVARYVEEGRLLLHDKARDADTGREGIVRDFLMAKGLRPHVRNNGTLGQQLDYVGREFIFPRESMRRTNLFEDKRMLILAVVGLSLSFIMMMPVGATSPSTSYRCISPPSGECSSTICSARGR